MKKMAIVTIAMYVMIAMLSSAAIADTTGSVSTDKLEYIAGETVMITITNNNQNSIALNGFTIENVNGDLIYSPSMLAYTKTLPPGEVFTDIWMQIDDNGDVVGPGTYTVKIEQDSVQIAILAPEETSLNVATDKLDYAVGENIIITLTNIGSKNVGVNGFWVEGNTGDILYTPKMLAYMRPLAPGESIEFTWDQTDDNGNPVAAGTYSICTQLNSVDIAIIEYVPIEVAVDKPGYKQGENILITLTNTGNKDASILNGYWIEDAGGSVVYTPKMLAYMRPLAPGASIEYTWDQTDDQGNPVVPGTYNVCTQQGNVTIEITAPGPGMNGQIHVGHSSVGPDNQSQHNHFKPKPTGTKVHF